MTESIIGATSNLFVFGALDSMIGAVLLLERVYFGK